VDSEPTELRHAAPHVGNYVNGPVGNYVNANTTNQGIT
jgi:hypothetical protein